MDKFLLFTTGGGSADPANFDSSEAALFNAKHLVGIKPGSKSTIEMFFQTETKEETVILTILGGSHLKVIKAISAAIASSNSPLVKIADVDTDTFASRLISGVSMRPQETYIQTISNNTKTKLNVPKGTIKSCMIANTDASDDVSFKLILTSKLSSDITDTGTDSNEADNASTSSSVTLTVDGTNATDFVFLNENVYKSNGLLYGVCTAVNSTTEIVFGGGLKLLIATNDSLYVGTKYTLFNDVSIPVNSTLKLNSDEISFDDSKYDLWVVSGDSGGQLNFFFNY
tara:strand:- start:368 stop:1222 length:855 start_codon:yes stop_codon:yes gene_type:complete